MNVRKAVLLLVLAGVLPAWAQTPSQVTGPAEALKQKWSLQQMQHMLADRPVMKTYLIGEQVLWVRQQDSIWQWVAERYAGKTTGLKTAWHEAVPTDGFEAMHAYGKDKAYIFLEDRSAQAAGGHNGTFEVLWSGVVFEHLNLENAKGFHELSMTAYEGRCSKDEYVRGMAALEHQALGKMQQFYLKVWLPWCAASRFVSNPDIWRNGHLPDFETWLAQYPPDSKYPWQYFRAGYDLIRKAREDPQKAEAAKASAK